MLKNTFCESKFIPSSSNMMILSMNKENKSGISKAFLLAGRGCSWNWNNLYIIDQNGHFQSSITLKESFSRLLSNTDTAGGFCFILPALF